MKCKFCGAENPDHAEFCQECGKKITAYSKDSNRKNWILGFILIVFIIGFIIFNWYYSSIQEDNIESVVFLSIDANTNLQELMNQSYPQGKEYIIYNDFVIENITYNNFIFPKSAIVKIKINKHLGTIGQEPPQETRYITNSLHITKFNTSRNIERTYQLNPTESFEELWEFQLEKKDDKWIIINSRMLSSQKINNQIEEITYKETTFKN